MVPTSDFSGLTSSACALASAVAMAPIDSLDRCMGALHPALEGEEVKAHRPGFRALGPNPMPDRLLGVLRHEAFQFGLGSLMLEISPPGPPEHAGELRP